MGKGKIVIHRLIVAEDKRGNDELHHFACIFEPEDLIQAHFWFGRWACASSLPFTFRDASSMGMEANIRCGIVPPLLMDVSDHECSGR